LPKSVAEVVSKLGVSADDVLAVLAELDVKDATPDSEIDDSTYDKLRIALITKGKAKLGTSSRRPRPTRVAKKSEATTQEVEESGRPKKRATAPRVPTGKKTKAPEKPEEAEIPGPERAPAKKKRVSSKKQVELLEAGEALETPTTKRLKRAVGVSEERPAAVHEMAAEGAGAGAETKAAAEQKKAATKPRGRKARTKEPEALREPAVEPVEVSRTQKQAGTELAEEAVEAAAAVAERKERKAGASGEPPVTPTAVEKEAEVLSATEGALGEATAAASAEAEAARAVAGREVGPEVAEVSAKPPTFEESAIAVEESPAQAPTGAEEVTGEAQARPLEAPPRKKKAKRGAVEEEEVRHVRRRAEPSVPVVKSAVVRRGITVAEFAATIGVSPSEVVKRLMELGQLKSVTMSLTDDEIELLGEAFGIEIGIQSPDILRAREEAARREQEAREDEGKLEPRPPVVTVMGHVDHGKTLLLDRIRKTNVAAQEFGGITQHIGAYRVDQGGRSITFIDTPGHEAFTAMRARGASVTDIAVLVVAADDGVMPQTVEAISHIRAAGVPMVVAINKIDKDEADPLRVKTQLTEHGVVVEELGGDVPCAEVSAMTGQGISDLLDLILLVADIAELKANPHAPASGVCIEAHVDPGKGPVATVLVKRGTLRRGDAFVAGLTYGRVRAMLDENGRQLEAATPSVPVQVIGFEEVAEAGDDFRVVADEKEARRIAEERKLAARQAEAVAPRVVRLEDLHEQLEAQQHARLGIILKADTQGSLEALREALRKLERPDVKLDLVHAAVGGISENDVMLAQASDAVIIGFNVRPDVKARAAASRAGVEIRTYEIIYKVVEEVEAAMAGLLQPETQEVVTGTAEVRATFKVPRVGVVAGCYVVDGQIARGSSVRVLRDGVVVYTGRIASLKRFKDDVRQVQAGYECGVGLEGFQDIKEGDVLETFEVREVARV
jgi:translation initiation factor IF-2